MRKAAVVVAILLAAYSLGMATVELRQGTRAVRMYLDDPPSPVLFAHFHTALSSALLGACALVFVVTRRCRSIAGTLEPSTRRFLDSQAVLLAGLALDERFRLLPFLSHALALPEALPYLVLGALEGLLLAGPGGLARAPRPEQAAVGGAAVLFVLALVLDDGPARDPLRGCVEDLPKVWGGALFLAFAWSRLEAALDSLAFPGLHGGAARWARAVASRDAPPPPVASPRIPEGRSTAPEPAGAGGGQRSGAPARGADAPEPDPKREASSASAAPPRKLLSH